MRLETRTWGEGERTALLVHGFAGDSGTWEHAAGALAGLGYRVIAPDLRGHGGSPRGYYSPQALAGDLAETLPAGADLALGHSVGAALLGLAAAELRPARLVYAEPYWGIRAVTDLPDPRSAARLVGMTAEEIAERNPGWSRAAVEAEARARALWDPRTMVDMHTFDMPALPESTAAPSLILLAERQGLIPEIDGSGGEARGFDVRTVPGTGHMLHLDDPEGFFAALRGWLEETGAAHPAHPAGASPGAGGREAERTA
ncbi:alpha/beta fold hydrolase [Nocardiopsis potens]|uniref:alpha/beta fold hydrolase n=1 Tax=Nocardiopsis potens TaxID=1246458 RepID=UPI0003448B65|nr:alpha/beta hydrolase [Nocardiopsis potens]